jgi:hypothetical protein
MNKKLFLVSVVTLLLGTTSVMADNHKHHDGPQKPKKEVVQKQNKKDDKKDKHSKNDRHYDSKGKHNMPKAIAKNVINKHKPVAHAHKSHHKPNHKPACRPDGRHGKSCHHCHKSHCNHRGHGRPVAPCRPIKNHVRITPPFSPIQVTVRI